MAEEVSESSTEEVAQTQSAQPQPPKEEPAKDPAPAEPTEQTQPAPEAKQPAPKPEPAEQPEPAQEAPEKQLPTEVEELDHVLHHLKEITQACEQALHAISGTDNQRDTQKRLDSYAKSLQHLAKSLQLLNDYRRHGKRLQEEAGNLQKELIEIRGGDQDAISSEESRVILETISAKETIVSVVDRLENVLTHVRNTTHPLIALVSYDRPGFSQFASNALRTVRVDWVSEEVHQSVDRVEALRKDLDAFQDLKAHAEELKDVPEAS